MKKTLNYKENTLHIKWISNEYQINELEIFLRYVRAENNWNEWVYLSSEEGFSEIFFKNVKILPEKEINLYRIEYHAEIKFDEQAQIEFISALNYCGGDIQGLIGFKLNNEIIDEDLFEIRCIDYV
tara:strand:- start:5021 stop:5398 length:378 start_codon:yes stop_codon:yes gene_type:complete